jgi:hypothetical protein
MLKRINVYDHFQCVLPDENLETEFGNPAVLRHWKPSGVPATSRCLSEFLQWERCAFVGINHRSRDISYLFGFPARSFNASFIALKRSSVSEYVFPTFFQRIL